MAKELILAHDIGTSGTKTSVINKLGEVVESYTTSHKTLYSKPGYAEQNPEDWWEGVVNNTKQILTKNSLIRNDISAIGVSGHMLGLIPVDNYGNALMNCMIHSDSRASEEYKYIEVNIGSDYVYKTTGNILDPRTSLCKSLWLKNKYKGVYDKTAKLLQSKDYINYKMTGSFSTDFSDASHAQFLDINNKDYCKDIINELGLSVQKLPTLHKSYDVIGHLTKEASKIFGLKEGIPVVAGGGDGACANVGAGVVSPGEAYICLGTTGWIAYISNDPVIDSGKRIFNILALDGENSGVFGTMSAAGRSLQWVMDLFKESNIDMISEYVDAVKAGSNGLIYLPYIEGERSPVFDSDAKGIFYGMQPIHKKEHFIRAVLEGVAFGLNSILEVYREKAKIKELAIIGGGAKSAAWRQIIADVLQVNISTTNVPASDATSIGAAITAGVGVGMYKDFADGTNTIKKNLTNTFNEEYKELYDGLFSIYMQIYPSLKSSFHQLKQLL